MNGLPPGTGWTLAIAGIALFALLLFLLAIRSGRWGVWVAGYLCVVLAVIVAMVAGHRRADVDRDPDAPAGASQLSSASGVLHAMDQEVT